MYLINFHLFINWACTKSEINFKIIVSFLMFYVLFMIVFVVVFELSFFYLCCWIKKNKLPFYTPFLKWMLPYFLGFGCGTSPRLIHGGFFSARLGKFHMNWLPCEGEALGIKLVTEHFAPLIRESNHITQHCTDSLPCVQAYKRAKLGLFLPYFSP